MAVVGELVKVVWYDAHCSVGNTAYAIGDIPHMHAVCESYGILLKHDEVGISIASEKIDDDTYRGYSFIPSSMLVKVEPINKPKKTRKKKTDHPSPDPSVQT